MEAVPKLSMLHFDLKYSPENTDFILKLKKLIHTHYQEDPDSFGKELGELGTLRSNACIRPSQDFSGISCMKKYYCQLNFIKSRFKIRSGTEDGNFSFPWYEVYSGALYTYSDFECEMSSVLYNIGAMHSILGSNEDRNSSEGLKVACTHFQCAAWAFHTLPDRHRPESLPDMVPDLLAFLSQVSLAQAQECILEKSILDHRKSSIIAKVGAQVSDYYKQALRKIESSNRTEAVDLSADDSIAEIVGGRRSKSWSRYCEFKMIFYQAVSYLYMGIQAEESQKMGERIAYYQKASDLLTASGKLAKNIDSDVISKHLLANCLTFSSDVINGKLEISKKENEFIFHEAVPDLDSLPELKGASLVKGIGFDPSDPEISGPDLFGRLVPLEAHEASSLYSEEKAKLLRSVWSEVEVKNEDLDVFLSSLSLEEVPKPGDHLSLPQELIEAAAGLSVAKEDVVKKLIESMGNIATVAADVEANLNEIRDYFEEETQQEREFKDIVGERPSSLMSELERECEKYEEAHRMASETNTTLHNAMKLHIDNLRILSKPLDELQNEIPSMADLDEVSEANIAEVHRLLAKIEEMKSQRAMLLEQFRNEVHEDDITKKLVVADKDLEEAFKAELSKHDGKRKIIQQNLLAQENILQALTETNARYANTRRIVAELINARTELIGSLVASFYAHEDILQKAATGFEFYNKLNTNVTKLLTRVKSFCKVQQEERDAILAKHHDKMMARPASADSYSPAAPPFMDAGSPTPNPGRGPVSVAGSGRPTLKDYLDMMKANKMPTPKPGTSTSANPDPSSGPASSYTAGNPYPAGYPGLQPNLAVSQFSSMTPVGPSTSPVPVAVGGQLKSTSDEHRQSPVNYNQAVIRSGKTTSQPQPSATSSSQPAVVSSPLPYQVSYPAYQGYYQCPQGPQLQNQVGVPGGAVVPGVSNPSQMRTSEAISTTTTPSHISTPSPAHSAPQTYPNPSYYPRQSFPSSRPQIPSTVATTVAAFPQNQAFQRPQYPYYAQQQIPQQYTHHQGVLQHPGGQMMYQSLGNRPAYTPPQQSTPSTNQSPTTLTQTPTTYGVQGQQQSFVGYNNWPASTSGSSEIPNPVRPALGGTNPMPIGYSPAPQRPSQPLNPGYQQTFPQQVISHPQLNLGYQPVSQAPGQHQLPGQAQRPGYPQAAPGIQGSVPPTTQTGQNTIRPSVNIQSGVSQPQPNRYPGAPLARPFSPGPPAGQPGPPAFTPVVTPQPQMQRFSSPGVQAPVEHKLRAVVPQPGTVPSQHFVQPGPRYQHPPVTSQSPLIAPSSGQSLDVHRRTSVEEMLGGEPKVSEPGVVLQPKVMTTTELEELKKEAQARDDIANASFKNPYDDIAVQQKLIRELSQLETILNDKNAVDAKWKEVLRASEVLEPGTKRTVSVARCYPMKNRVPDVLPFDQTRVDLPATKDDYINASRIKQLTPHAPKFVATQAPTSNTLADFWMMVWQEQVETMICLMPEVTDVYWPTERKEPLKILKILEVTLQSSKSEQFWTERILTVLNKETNTSRVVIHLQLNPTNPSEIQDSLVVLASTSLSYHRQQRVLTHPVVVHCLTGSGKTAAFMLLLAALAEINLAGAKSETIIPDMTQIAATLCQQRKGILKERDLFRQALQGVARCARDLLVKVGALEPHPPAPIKDPQTVEDRMPIDSNLNILSTSLGFDLPATTTPNDPPLPLVDTHLSTESTKLDDNKSKFFTADLNKLADLSLDPMTKSTGSVDESPRRKKITKQDFLNAEKNKGIGNLKTEADPADPLSQLDPLWGLKH